MRQGWTRERTAVKHVKQEVKVVKQEVKDIYLFGGDQNKILPTLHVSMIIIILAWMGQVFTRPQSLTVIPSDVIPFFVMVTDDSSVAVCDWL